MALMPSRSRRSSRTRPAPSPFLLTTASASLLPSWLQRRGTILCWACPGCVPINPPLTGTRHHQPSLGPPCLLPLRQRMTLPLLEPLSTLAPPVRPSPQFPPPTPPHPLRIQPLSWTSLRPSVASLACGLLRLRIRCLRAPVSIMPLSYRRIPSRPRGPFTP